MMQLNKNKKSAIVLSVIIVLSFSLTTAIVDILVPVLFSDSYEYVVVRNTDTAPEPENIFGIAILIFLILIVLITIGAFWLYRFFGESHYGQRSAFRWSLFGIIFALLLQVFDLIFQENLPIIQGILQFLSVFAAYFISRFIIPLELRTKKT